MSSPINSADQSPAVETAHATQVGNDPKDKKPTVLETHGYFLGKSIGTGSYATVRVRKAFGESGHFVRLFCAFRWLTVKDTKAMWP